MLARRTIDTQPTPASRIAQTTKTILRKVGYQFLTYSKESKHEDRGNLVRG